jgi:GNAT superfamily N-acetyltransferase
MRAKEFTKPNTITLDQIYDGQMPDSDEHIWNYISPNDFNIPFTINTIQPMTLRNILEIQYGVDDIEDLFHKMQPEQEEIIQHYTNDSDLSNQIIILHKDRIIDGNHRALAAVLAKKPIRYVDVSEDIEEVNEDSEFTKPKFKVEKKKNSLSVRLILDNEVIGQYQYDNNSNRHLAEVLPKYKGKGYGKLLLLKALEVANDLGFEFIEDESRTNEYDNLVDSLENSGYVVRDNDQIYLTQNGLDYLNSQQSLNEKWSQKYKRSINCNNPKGFSQRAHCQGRKKKTNEDEDVSKFVKNKLKAAGYKFIGSGYDAQVWMKDEGTVVKILMPKEDNTAHDTFKTFYQLSKKLNSPNLPKFKQVDGREVYNFSINNLPFVQYGMEQLYPLEKGSLDEYVVWNLADYSAKQLDWAKVVDLISKDSVKGMYPNAEKLQKEFVAQNTSKLKEYEIFYNTLRKLHKVGNSKEYGWDPHTENVMRRSDGTLVITDPWA